MSDTTTAAPATEFANTTTMADAISSELALKNPISYRVRIRSIVSRPDGGAGLAGQSVRVGGWVRTGREHGKGRFAFLEVNDRSSPDTLQVIVDAAVYDLRPLLPAGTTVDLKGMLNVPPQGSKEKIELRVEQVLSVGLVDPTYPILKTKLTFEYLRDFNHLRARTNVISSITRIQNALSFATHSFFQENMFLYVRTPIITTSDCEGGGEMFQVTTLFSEAENLEKDLEAAKLVVKLTGEVVHQLKADNADEAAIVAVVAQLNKAKENVSKLEERSKLRPGIPQKEDGKIDYAADFFGRQAFLTVSGQLHAEAYACAVDNVYTFGPTFRAENSHTSRHLAEFWMVEPEIAFADLQDDMNYAEAYVKYMCSWLLEKCYDDMEFMATFYDEGCIERLRMVSTTPFERISYTEAVKILEEAIEGGKKFDNRVEWGIDLASEHERFLTEVKFQKPVILYDYPKGIKPFYMRLNDDSKTVAAMDVLVPKVGELIGGSQREERYDVIKQRMLEMGMELKPYEWYLDLRRYGTVKHSGFGLGFDRMVLFATGMDNIRDVIPFPRTPGRADI